MGGDGGELFVRTEPGRLWYCLVLHGLSESLEQRRRWGTLLPKHVEVIAASGTEVTLTVHRWKRFRLPTKDSRFVLPYSVTKHGEVLSFFLVFTMFYLKIFHASVILGKLYFLNSVTVANNKTCPVLRRRDKTFLPVLIKRVVHLHALHFTHYMSLTCMTCQPRQNLLI